MKKLCIAVLIVCSSIATTRAQDAAKIMAGLGGGILAPGCTNCTSLSGFNLFGGYLLSDKIVAKLEIGFYSKTDGSSTLNSNGFGISGDYYFKSATNGFYLGPDLTFLTITQKFNGTEVFAKNNITIGINAGWGIPVADNWRIIPHFGYGTWYDNSSGRITAGLKVGYIFK